ncbi:extracellular solute-binding protein [Bacillus licheniformis]|nr:extracellular solute-binding protein [Bacillus licheniformis]
MSKEVLNATQDDLARQFAAGQLAMMINGSWNIERLEEAEDLNYGITYIPKDQTFASALGGENIAVVKGKTPPAPGIYQLADRSGAARNADSRNRRVSAAQRFARIIEPLETDDNLKPSFQS